MKLTRFHGKIVISRQLVQLMLTRHFYTTIAIFRTLHSLRNCCQDNAKHFQGISPMKKTLPPFKDIKISPLGPLK